MNELDFTGQRVLVVGGSSGIGNGIARSFYDRGAAVHVWGTRPSAADYADSEGSNLEGLGYSCVDVSNPDIIADAQPPFSEPLDVLVLSQGIVAYRREEFKREAWDNVMAVNLDSLLHCCQKFKADLKQQSGAVVIVSSLSGYRANIGNPAYAASKAGAINLTMSLAQAWASEGIRVNGLAPGLVDTKLTKVTTEHEGRRAAALQSIPVGRFGTPGDMAGAALFLASPLAGYVCGQTILVDGGLGL